MVSFVINKRFEFSYYNIIISIIISSISYFIIFYYTVTIFFYRCVQGICIVRQLRRTKW